MGSLVNQSFDGKVITVAGASRGTGLATVKYLLSRGATISMSSSSAENMQKAWEEVVKEFPGSAGRLMSYVCDITSLEAVEEWISATMNKFGRINGCANVSGKEQRRLNALTDMPLEDWREIMDVNLNGMFYLLREQMRVMSEGGSIVNVASVCSKYASANAGAYIASKHALVGLTKAAAFEGAPRGVRVNAICPGGIRTDMVAKPFVLPDGSTFVTTENIVPQLLRRFAEPAAICFLLGDESTFVTKAEWYVDGGFMEGSYTG
ncbi:hypothetical protein BX600DRAFT_519286 [Xylariales sp. PMI_506]|nr:hypothetical protein BX600DRAFT_519286 [Xylariales sp. PMI_506]